MSVSCQRPKPLQELEETAKEATRQALASYTVPESIHDQLVLGVFIEGKHAIFELYVPGKRPEDARIITRAQISRFSGEVVSVEVFLE